MALSFLCVKVVVVGVQPHNTSHIGDTNDTHRNHFFTHSLHSLTHVGTRSVRIPHLPHHHGRKAPKGHTMTPERLEQIEEHDSPLTANELALGWHFCTEFDGMLTSGEPTNRDTPEALLICACGNKINPNTCITYEGEEPHGTRDTFVPPPQMSFQEEERAEIAKARAFIAKDDARDILIREMQEAIDSITEEDMKPIDRPVPPIPSPEDKTVHYHNKRWWFWDETGQHRHGPYETHAECIKDLNHYCNVYLGHPEDPS